MKIKSNDYWRLCQERDSAKHMLVARAKELDVARHNEADWRCKYELLLLGGVDQKLEREKAFERGRQHGLLSVRGHLVEALNNLVADPPTSTDPITPIPPHLQQK